MASPISPNNKDATLLTLPLDLLQNITNDLSERDEKALKLTCKRMNLLVAQPPPHANHLAQLASQQHDDDAHQDHFLTVGVSRDLIPRDGRSTPIPQSPLPFKAAKTLQELELENREVEDREVERGMELTDSEDGDRDDDEEEEGRRVDKDGKPTKFKSKKNILNWTAELESAPSSPGLVRSPMVGGGHGDLLHGPRAASPAPALPTFTLTIQ